MAVAARAYRPPFLTQRGIDSTLNDCRVVATLHGVADATLGEAVTTRKGQEMSQTTLRRLARRMLEAIDRLNAPGGLNTSHTRAMIDALWPAVPTPAVITITFLQMKAQLMERKAGFSVSGNPTKIKGDSPIKRTTVAHEFYIQRANKDGSKFLVYDGMRPAGKDARGEWRPAREVRQFAFKDSDGALVGVVRYPIGEWTAASLIAATLRRRLRNVRAARDEAEELVESRTVWAKSLEDEIVVLKKVLEDCAEPSDCAIEIDTALRNEREEISGLVLARST